MNKTLLLVTCDFLLLSMLALARIDLPQNEETASAIDQVPSMQASESDAELLSLLEESLKYEAEANLESQQKLEQLKGRLNDQNYQLVDSQRALQLATTKLDESASEVQKLTAAQEKSKILEEKWAEEQQRMGLEYKNLSKHYEASKNLLEETQRTQAQLVGEIKQRRLKLEQVSARAALAERRRYEQALLLEERSQQLDAALEYNKKLVSDQKDLNQKLQVVLAENRVYADSLKQEKGEKALVLEHANKLSESLSGFELGFNQVEKQVNQMELGVTVLKDTTQQIMVEMETSRPRTLSELYDNFQKNRVFLNFKSVEKSLLGSSSTQTYLSQSVLVEDENGIYIPMHTADTPFRLDRRNLNILELTLDVTLGQQRFSPDRIFFLASDARVAFVAVPKEIYLKSKLNAFKMASLPLRRKIQFLLKMMHPTLAQYNFGHSLIR